MLLLFFIDCSPITAQQRRALFLDSFTTRCPTHESLNTERGSFLINIDVPDESIPFRHLHTARIKVLKPSKLGSKTSGCLATAILQPTRLTSHVHVAVPSLIYCTFRVFSSSALKYSNVFGHVIESGCSLSPRFKS